MTSIKNTCVLVKVSIGRQGYYVNDKQITNKVEAEFSTHGRGQWKKRIFKDCPAFKALMSATTDISTELRNRTLAWDDSYRVCKSAELLPLMADIGDRIRKMDDLANKFVENYHDYVQQDIASSNGMMRPEDYPDSNEIKDKFYAKFKISPIPDSDDFRVMEGIPEEEADKLMEQVREDERNRVANAMTEAHKRLYTAVEHMHNRLAEYTGAKGEKLHKSVVNNVKDCVETLRKLNLNGDAELNSMLDQIENKVLPDADIERIKVVPHERQEVVNKVSDIMRKMRFFGDNQQQ
jgi:vacuolar-type H+-ATPase subunit H